jgi:putative phage-type endonuclease
MRLLFDKTNQNESDWQEFRSNMKGIGGSDASIILGLNPFKSAFSLWLEKTGEIKPPDLSSNEFIEWGNLLEPIIRNKFRKETGFEVFENHFVLQHDEHDWMVANIDGEVIDPQFKGKKGVLEIKTTSERNKEDWKNGCPNHYMLQIQHYLAVTGYEYGYVAVLIGGNHFKYFLIHRDDYVIDQIISAELDFQEKVEKKIPPLISGNESDSNSLTEMFPQDNGEEDELSPEFEKLAFEYIKLQQEIKYLEGESNSLKNQIKLYAGESKKLIGEKLKISLPTVKKVIFDSKGFQTAYPDLYEQFKTKESIYRSMTISLLK